MFNFVCQWDLMKFLSFYFSWEHKSVCQYIWFEKFVLRYMSWVNYCTDKYDNKKHWIKICWWSLFIQCCNEDLKWSLYDVRPLIPLCSMVTDWASLARMTFKASASTRSLRYKKCNESVHWSEYSPCHE